MLCGATLPRRGLYSASAEYTYLITHSKNPAPTYPYSKGPLGRKARRVLLCPLLASR
jgi:hypothetical protein